MNTKNEIPVIKVNQWLSNWDTVQFDDKTHQENRKKPLPYFFMFTIKAGLLKKLSKVYPRRDDGKRDIEIGIQRKHDPARSKEITAYIKSGYPLSEMKSNNGKDEHPLLQMPGWLPTAIVANILSEGTTRGENTIDKLDLVKVIDTDPCKLILPSQVLDAKWNPKVPPIEIIDGQHRLWAFEDNKIADEFELPVVAFYNLDITWQAYLFYTINVKPKKINRSLAYDLYPLLRVQEWLEQSPDTAYVYKETRAQEIIEVLWSYEKSPWKGKINMLGEVKYPANITQAAFIRNLISTFIKTTTTKKLGGLFGAKLNDIYKMPLEWNRTQQASFIIFAWQIMYETISTKKLKWAENLRNNEHPSLFDDKGLFNDLAFNSKFSLISTDQGVRGFLHIINDIIFTLSDDIKIRNIQLSKNNEIKEDRIDSIDIEETIRMFKKSTINKLLLNICEDLVKFDWRTSSEPNLTQEERKNQMVFKGSSGYKELRSQLLQQLMKSSNNQIKDAANVIFKELGYAK